jgi:hypothetical protein
MRRRSQPYRIGRCGPPVYLTKCTPPVLAVVERAPGDAFVPPPKEQH